MANSYVELTANGSATSFSFSFSYIDSSDIALYVDGVVTAFTFTSSNTLSVTTPPISGAVVRIERTTDSATRLVDFSDGSILTEADLDNSAQQVFNLSQEAVDKTGEAIYKTPDGKMDVQSKVLKNVANGVADGDAVNKGQLGIEYPKIETVADNMTTVTSVSNSIASVNTTAGSIANVNTVATNITKVNTVSADIAKVIKVADDLLETVSEIETVADDLNETSSEIEVVANAIANVDIVGGAIASVNATGGNIANVNTVATNITNINAVNTNEANINAVNTNQTNINAVQANEANINTVATNNANVTAVAGKATEIALLGTPDAISDMNTLAVSTVLSDIATVSTNAAAVSTVSGSIANVNTVVGDTANINTVASNITNVNTLGSLGSEVSALGALSTEISNLGNNTALQSDIALLGSSSVVADIETLADTQDGTIVSNGLSSLAATTTDIDMIFLYAIKDELVRIINSLPPADSYLSTWLQANHTDGYARVDFNTNGSIDITNDLLLHLRYLIGSATATEIATWTARIGTPSLNDTTLFNKYLDPNTVLPPFWTARLSIGDINTVAANINAHSLPVLVFSINGNGLVPAPTQAEINGGYLLCADGTWKAP
jgi:hypothetical protein